MKHLVIIPLFLLASCSSSSENLPEISDSDYKVSILAQQLDRPWAVAELAPNRYIITERSGKVRLFEDGQLSQPITFPKAVFDSGQGGLLDVAIDRQYPSNGWLYFSYAAGNDEANGTALLRAKLINNKLEQVQPLFQALPLKSGGYHYGGRIEFLADNTLVMSVGDAYHKMEDAQKLDSHLGKIIRIHPDGRIPADNPFIGIATGSEYIFSYGHRNPQGLSFDANSNTLFANEHGPRGGDELNTIIKGQNYGWPKATYGINYNFTTITEHTSLPDAQSPKINWTPSIAPSSLAIYHPKDNAPWSESLLTTTLKFKQLRIISNDGQYSQKIALTSLDTRLRDILVDSQNNLILVTDSGQLIRVHHAQ